MLIRLTSILSGNQHEMDLDISEDQYKEFFLVPRNKRRMIQEIFPNLSLTEREFLMTGMSREEQDIVFEMEEEYADDEL